MLRHLARVPRAAAAAASARSLFSVPSVSPLSAAVVPGSSTASASASASQERRVLCVDVSDASCVQELVQRGHTVDQIQLPSEDELLQVIDQYDALLVAPTATVPTTVLAQGAAARLRLVAFPTDAIDSGMVDTTEATAHGVLLLQLDKKQVGDKFSVEAEAALSLLLQLARRLPDSIAASRTLATGSGHTGGGPPVPIQREQFRGTELSGKALGIVGLGQAGKCVVEMARAMGLQVLGFDPNLTHEAAALMGVKRVSLDELYAQSDFVSFHAPLTGKTRGMFDAAALAQCKAGVTLVSVAEYKGRDGLLDPSALLVGLSSGKIAGVGLDVLEDGQPVTDMWRQLQQHANVLVATHADGKSSTSKTLSEGKKYRAIAENMSDALAQRYYRGVANGVFMPLTLEPEMQPFLQLSESLGKLLFDLVVTNDPKDPITKVTVAATGGVQVDITATKAKSALQSAVVKGILECIRAKRGGDGRFGAARISLLNATMLAMNNGIDVRVGELETLDSTTHLNNSVTVQVETKSNETFLVMGSVFGEDPRVVRINEYTDFPAFRPEGNLLLFKNEDKPGAIAGILKELSEAQINIANFGLSRSASVDLALGILALDAPPSPETMTKLKTLPTVQDVQFARV